MPVPLHRTLSWWIAGALLALAGAAWIARADLLRQREAFDTDARIAHRLLSQRVVEQDAILATLALLQPGEGGTAEIAPEQRLPALYPQVLGVIKRDRDAVWPDPRLAVAEAASRAQQRAVLAQTDFAAGRYTLLRAADPASYALTIDLQRMVPWAEWPMPRDGPVHVALVHEGQTLSLQAGREGGTAWRFDFSKHLAAESQPFDVVATRSVGLGDLPWATMAAWAAASAALMAALAAWQRQRTERQRAEELVRLGQVGRLNAMGELAAGMAHELNQPLTALLANTQAANRLLAEDPPELDTAREAMSQAVQQARRASEVVTRLRRAVQRPDAQAALRPLALAEVVNNVLYLLEPEFARQGVVPRVVLPAAMPKVQADPVAVEQIVHNLLTNALQALERTPPGQRELVLIAEARAGQVMLRVQDSGPGIPIDALPRVFEPFFTTRSEGLGLGLSLCESLAAGMGGELACSNRVPHGAEFRLSLPAA